MPTLPSDDRNLITGLSDFWVSYFKDTSFTEAYFKGGQVLLGQAYLELLQTVLGTSLNHVPLFSKYYYRYLPIREDQVAYVEGQNSDADRFVYDSPDTVARADLLMNRVIAPTKTLDVLRDYGVAEGSIQFHVDPFDVDGAGASLVQFPVRTVPVEAAASLTNLRGVSWRDLGARPGDDLWFEYPVGLPPKTTRIQAIDVERLMLADDLPEFDTTLTGRAFRFHVVRIPFDHQKVGAVTPRQATAYELLDASPDAGAKTVTLATAPALTPAVGQYVYVADAGVTKNDAYARVTGVAGPVLTLDVPNDFLASAGPVAVYLVDHGVSTSTAAPAFAMPNDLVDAGSLFVTGRRAVARVLRGTVTPLPGTTNYVVDALAVTVTYPAGNAVQEGVDYAVDYFAGVLQYLTLWDPLFPSRSDYTWRLRVATEAHAFRGAFAPATAYAAGDVVTSSGAYFVSRAAFTSGGSFAVGDWNAFAPPFGGDALFALREIAVWAPDVLLDRDALYNNFGYLLGFRKSSSESYRAFLQGVSQLFLRGPTLERFESALNVVAGLPVVRDDGEVLTGYDSGYVDVGTDTDPTLGHGGRLIDTAYGRDGVTASGLATFTSATAGFFASDVGAILQLRTATGVAEYAVTAVSADGLTATLAPAPPDAVDVEWSYAHNLLSQRFRIDSDQVTYLFGDADVDAEVVIASASEAKNVGSFRIASVVSQREVVLDTPFGFVDAAGLDWRLTRTRTQTVTTSRAAYDFPVRVPMREFVTDPANYGVLVLGAFDALSAVVDVVDYVSDPTWWHHVAIPNELLALVNDAPGRRVVTPNLIPHIVDAVDQAVINDFGILAGRDDTGQPGIERHGAATWLGGPWVQLDFLADPSIPGTRPRDVGEYATIAAGPFRGSYRIDTLSSTGDAVRLERFPPPAARDLTPSLPIADVELPPIVYRRTVAYVLMDRFLKYHAMQIRINTGGGVSADFLSEATQLIKEAKPSHVFVYLEPGTSFSDTMTMTDSILLTWGPSYADNVRIIDNDFTGSTLSIIDEYHRHSSGVYGAISPGGLETFTVVPTFPYVPDRYVFVFGRFSGGSAAGAPLDEGVNYAFDRSTGLVTVPAMDAGAYAFRYVVVALRQLPFAVDWWTTGALGGETPACVHGADPLVTAVDPALLGPGDYGLVDRPLEITIT